MKQTATSVNKECKQTTTSTLINGTKNCAYARLEGVRMAHKCAYAHDRVKGQKSPKHEGSLGF